MSPRLDAVFKASAATACGGFSFYFILLPKRAKTLPADWGHVPKPSRRKSAEAPCLARRSNDSPHPRFHLRKTACPEHSYKALLPLNCTVDAAHARVSASSHPAPQPAPSPSAEAHTFDADRFSPSRYFIRKILCSKISVPQKPSADHTSAIVASRYVSWGRTCLIFLFICNYR